MPDDIKKHGNHPLSSMANLEGFQLGLTSQFLRYLLVSGSTEFS